MIILVTVRTILGYLTCNSIAVMAPVLQDVIKLTTQEYSYIVAAYSACYTVMQPIAGYVLDLLGTQNRYSLFAILWSLFCVGSAFSFNWIGLAFIRGAVGTTKTAMIPTGLKATREWFPAKERSIAVGWFNLGSTVGAMLAPPLVAWAIWIHSWECAFILCGVFSFIWGICWLDVYRHPTKQKHLSDEERKYILSGQEASHHASNQEKLSTFKIISSRRFWGIALPRFLAEPAWGTFNAWIPLFMFTTYHFDLKQIAIFALIVGALVDTLGFSPLFVILSCLDLLAAVAVWTILKAPKTNITKEITH